MAEGERVKNLRDLNGRKEIAIDYQFINDVLSGKAFSPDQYQLQPIYNRLSFMEASIADMERGTPIMHVGTGWPGTAIGLYTQFSIPVTCVEKDPEFAQQSFDGLKRLGLIGKDKLSVVCADGADLKPDGFKVITISAMVPNPDKEKIIRNMREMATDSPTDPLLILRTPTRTGFLLYEELNSDILNNPWLTYIEDSSQLIGPEDPLRSTVYRVKSMAEFKRGSDRIFMNAQTRLQSPVPLAA